MPLQDEGAHERYRRFRAARDHTAPPERRSWWRQCLAVASLRGESRQPVAILPLDVSMPAPARVHESVAVAVPDRACDEALAAPAIIDCADDMESLPPPPPPPPPDATHCAGFGGRCATWVRVARSKAYPEAPWVVDDFEGVTPIAACDDHHDRDRPERSSDTTLGSSPSPRVAHGKASGPVLEAVHTGTELFGSASTLSKADAELSPRNTYLGAALGESCSAPASGLTAPDQALAKASLQPDVQLHRMLSRGPGGHGFDAAAADVAAALRNPLWLVRAGLNLI